MTKDLSIQTVHGVSHPFVVQAGQSDEAEDHEPPEPQHYREAVSERLEKIQQQEESNVIKESP
ncbi:hypothetical protein LF1_11640 [Rubripirellula obstinata]|uniref:Uncharacterized protein n=1 Tax=Rubripirellula obstinata TaxID=406547 RepID=A0A5B1CEJ6_9BACT|nr:hypothetical protein [Rubripirellula obstinata]KAA1258642.1 hypothetical protein LF1_11640 [Rubripirellula obstinata]